MRCPKCHYLSFDPEPRCKNCGYGLTLDDGDLLLRESDVGPHPFADLSLHAAEASAAPDLDVMSALPPEVVAVPTATIPPPAARPAPTTELPLFVKGLPPMMSEVAREADPMMKAPAEPRPPLAVRRKVAEPSISKPRHTIPSSPRAVGPLDRDLLADLQRFETLERKQAGGESRAERHEAEPASRVGAAARLAAAALDAVLMGTLGMAVLWVTLRWCDLPIERAVAMWPVVVPTGAFLLLVAVGYLLMFTAAGGQTVGKMALGIRVVGEPSSEGDLLTARQVVSRVFLTIPSVLVFGAGFLPALVGDERALHDRLSHTRVVRA